MMVETSRTENWFTFATLRQQLDQKVVQRLMEIIEERGLDPNVAPLTLADLEEIRDHIAVEDVARLAISGLRRRTAGVLNAATGKAVSFHEAASLVARLMGKPVDIVPSPRANPVR